MGAVVSIAFAFDDLCNGFDRDRGLATLVAAVCLGGLAGTLLDGRRGRHAARGSAVGLVASIVAFFGVYVLVVLSWVGECSR